MAISEKGSHLAPRKFITEEAETIWGLLILNSFYQNIFIKHLKLLLSDKTF